MGGYNKRGYLNSDFKIFHLTDQISTEFEFHYHEFHKITIFISGNVQYFVEGKTYPLEPYDIVLVNRNDIHRVQVDPSLPYERIIVYISPGFIDAYRTDDYDLSYCFEKAKKEHSNVLRIHSLEKSSLFKITNRLERSFSDTEYGAWSRRDSGRTVNGRKADGSPYLESERKHCRKERKRCADFCQIFERCRICTEEALYNADRWR